jgi:hypothetical protein
VLGFVEGSGAVKVVVHPEVTDEKVPFVKLKPDALGCPGPGDATELE